MTEVNRVTGDMYVAGTLRARAMDIPALTIVDADVAAAAAIAASKLEHQFPVRYSQADGTDVAAAIVPIHICRGTTGEVIAVEVSCIDAPEGGDKTLTVDVGIQSAGVALASILTGVRTYPAETADATILAATIDDGTLADGDTLVVTVAVSGSTGNQGQGLVVTTFVREDAD